MSHGIRIKSDKEKKNAYAALCMMKYLYKKGNLQKAQYKNMVKLCSPYFDTSDFLSGVSFYISCSFQSVLSMYISIKEKEC